jgi:hydroxymethylpyrimidine pyrophosphatase-like HAD family hydrolase
MNDFEQSKDIIEKVLMTVKEMPIQCVLTGISGALVYIFIDLIHQEQINKEFAEDFFERLKNRSLQAIDEIVNLKHIIENKKGALNEDRI